MATSEVMNQQETAMARQNMVVIIHTLEPCARMKTHGISNPSVEKNAARPASFRQRPAQKVSSAHTAPAQQKAPMNAIPPPGSHNSKQRPAMVKIPPVSKKAFANRRR